MKIKKGDKVRVIAGKDRGREGVVDQALPKKNAVILPEINLYKKAVRPKKEGDKGGIIDVARPLDISKVMLICPKCHKPTRVGYQLSDKGKNKKDGKLRVCKKCRELI
ncbi:MAG: 50S ribosomal protein L24 [Candidatus Shapirobacteria bacterium]|nr:50S ribosomal protein L24 [Candidatus Shapirobacteria bacterium]MDD5073922.1 50S ribosomal protein L24 [Candidatus Shapirobacteria bacterium]MDD5481562.1 50S ribosomal protein L24 [Candidatus Shapirobacteria bacterium]